MDEWVVAGRERRSRERGTTTSKSALKQGNSTVSSTLSLARTISTKSEAQNSIYMEKHAPTMDMASIVEMHMQSFALKIPQGYVHRF